MLLSCGFVNVVLLTQSCTFYKKKFGLVTCEQLNNGDIPICQNLEKTIFLTRNKLKFFFQISPSNVDKVLKMDIFQIYCTPAHSHNEFLQLGQTFWYTYYAWL